MSENEARDAGQMTYDGFLSYSHEDSNLVRRIYHDLKRYQLAIWVDERGIAPGDYLSEEVERAIRSSRYFVITVTSHSLHSDWVRLELQTALTLQAERKYPIVVPIVADHSRLPPMLAARMWIDFRPEVDYFASLNKLVACLRSSALKDVNDAEPSLHSGVCKNTILLDQGHNQQKWEFADRPLLNLDYSLFAETARDVGLQIVPVHAPITLDKLAGSSGLILVMPYHCSYTDQECLDIETFVRVGGGLIALGYYLGDRHHNSNLSKLLKVFGVGLCADRIWDTDEHELSNLHIIASCRNENPIVPVNTRILLPLTCSLRVQEPAQPLFVSGDNCSSQEVDLVIGGLARSFREISCGQQTVAAFLNYGLGRILVMGSWEPFTIRSLINADFENEYFLRCALKWITGGIADGIKHGV